MKEYLGQGSNPRVKIMFSRFLQITILFKLPDSYLHVRNIHHL